MNEEKLFEKLDNITNLLETMNLFLQERITFMEDVDSALMRVGREDFGAQMEEFSEKGLDIE